MSKKEAFDVAAVSAQRHIIAVGFGERCGASHIKWNAPRGESVKEGKLHRHTLTMLRRRE